MTNKRYPICGETVSIEGRQGEVIEVCGHTVEVCWKVGDAMGEETEAFDLMALPASFEVLTPEPAAPR